MQKGYLKLGSLLIVAALMLCNYGFSQDFTKRMPVPDTIDSPNIELLGDTLFNDFIPGYAGQDSFNHVRAWAYNKVGSTTNTFLGPTLIWRPGRFQNISIRNTLGVSTTVHWHGAHIPARWDGGPHNGFGPDSTWRPHFQILDAPATMWYHPHYAEHTWSQVEMGLAGIVIIEDTVNDPHYASLPHTYNKDDFPIIIQDRQFQKIAGTASDYEIDTLKNNTLTRWNVVNGIIKPFLDVPAQMVRFRLLDGSSRNCYYFGIVDANGNDVPFQVIASDAGYLEEPVSTTRFLTAPGIRCEFVVDFQNYQGTSLYLVNYPIDASKWKGHYVADAPTGNMLKFEVMGQTVNPVLTIPTAFSPHDRFPGLLGKTRDIILGGGSPNLPNNPGVPFNINGNQFIITKVNDFIELDAIEEWDLINTSNVAHPFHIHDIHFFVTNVDSNGVNIPQANWPLEFLGPKDDVIVPENYSVTFRTKFTDFATATSSADSAYMYHCHILTHEDGLYAGVNHDSVGMMQQFLVVPQGYVATEAQSLTEDMMLYPNPAQDMLHLRGESTKPSNVVIYDLRGKILLQQELRPFNGTVDIPLADMARGMILVQWRNSNGTFTRKVVLD